MKQKIVIKVQMKCGKCRREAMKIVAPANGVMSVVIQGTEKDEIVVVGNEIDSAGLCSTLRKKVGRAILVSVEEVKDPKPEEKKMEKGKSEEQKKGEEKKEEEMKKSETTLALAAATMYTSYSEPNYYCSSPQFHTSNFQLEENPSCSIM